MSNNTIKFRTKFQKAFPDKLERLADLFRDYLSLSENFFISILWKLTYDPRNLIYDENYDHALVPIYCIFSDEKVDVEKLLLLRNELRYQYSLTCQAFLKPSNFHPFNDDISAAFETLSKVTDDITAYVVQGKCQAFTYYSDNDVARCLYLLRSSKKENVFGGLRTLSFSQVEADYLLGYGKEIAILLENISKAASNVITFSQTASTKITEANVPTNESVSSDKSNIQSELNEMNMRKGDEEKMENGQSITPELVMEHQELFTKAISVLKELDSFNISLQEVSSKSEAIEKLLGCLHSFE